MTYKYARCPSCNMLVKVCMYGSEHKIDVPVELSNDPELVAAVLKGLPTLKYECEICYQKKFKDYFKKNTGGVNG